MVKYINLNHKWPYIEYRINELREMLYKEYLETGEWQNARKRALKAAGYKCQLCGAENTELDVHHNNYDRLGLERPDDIIVLCKACHAKQHNKEI